MINCLWHKTLILLIVEKMRSLKLRPPNIKKGSLSKKCNSLTLLKMLKVSQTVQRSCNLWIWYQSPVIAIKVQMYITIPWLQIRKTLIWAIYGINSKKKIKHSRFSQYRCKVNFASYQTFKALQYFHDWSKYYFHYCQRSSLNDYWWNSL